MNITEKKVIKRINNLSGDYKCYDENLTYDEVLVLDKLLNQLKEAKEYLEPLRNFNTNNQYLEKLKEIIK